MTVEEKLKKAIEVLGLKKQVIAEQMEISQGSLSNALGGRQKLNSEHLVKLGKKFPEILVFVFGLHGKDVERCNQTLRNNLNDPDLLRVRFEEVMREHGGVLK